MTTRKALGRGLEALIPRRPEASAVARLAPVAAVIDAPAPLEVAIERIQKNRVQPRRRFDDDKLEELAVSIRANGVLQPLLVREVNGAYELVAGERRLRAAILAGRDTVPVVVRQDVDDRESLKLALLENVQRQDLNPMEEAQGYARLMQDFGMSQQDLAERLGKSRSAIANTLRLTSLPAELQTKIEKGELSAGHARALLSAGSLEEQIEIAQLVREQGLNVRETEHLAQARRKRRTQTTVTNPALEELQKRMESRLGTRVRLRARKADGSAGRIEIDYYSLVDLERIFELAGVSYLL
ncbi:MAG TPA: ParB/RepB/Spo0J family partition protein [Candidatus Krumholzibacteria bacterium]|nr:ParB/RepB/Spo0J family partition protein [Candidatus Krumholzibacteria bacterium]